MMRLRDHHAKRALELQADMTGRGGLRGPPCMWMMDDNGLELRSSPCRKGFSSHHVLEVGPHANARAESSAASRATQARQVRRQ